MKMSVYNYYYQKFSPVIERLLKKLKTRTKTSELEIQE